jgi:hypothetical protein
VTVTHTVNTASTTTWEAKFAGLPSGYDIANLTYIAWCADKLGDFTHNRSDNPAYTLYSTLDSAHLPPLAQSPNWDKINWVLNHKAGQNSWAVQQVIWRLLSGTYETATGYPLPQPAADNLYNQAITLGAGFVPAGGQTIGILMYVDGLAATAGAPGEYYQDILIEAPMPDCGSGTIGDYVWNDSSNPDGLQQAGEPGINGVTVRSLTRPG